MITKEMVDKINEYARRVKAGEVLTEEEVADRARLRRAYIDAFKENLRAQLENIEFVDEPSSDEEKLN